MFKKQKNHLQNQRGQVAIFVALIFQVLFVFFAMVINVGLLVHHKINLQNAVDIAAYYGGAKQAEMLNAIAHVNYQIRQDYKLLLFRYQQMGSAGYESIPIDVDGNPGPAPYAPSTDTVNNSTDAQLLYNPIFCIIYPPVYNLPNSETFCKKFALKPVALTPLTIPSIPTGPYRFNIIASVVAGAVQKAINNVANDCYGQTVQNWYSLAKILYAYKVDLANRKQLLIALANQVSKDASTFTDLDNQPIKQGIFNTFVNNLTYQNADSIKTVYDPTGNGNGNQQVDFEVFNSLSAGGCGETGDPNEAPNWLSEINFYPQFSVLDSNQCDPTKGVTFVANLMFNGDSTVATPFQLASQNADIQKAINNLAQVIVNPSGAVPAERLYKTSLGFEKNPWCMAYVGVKARTTPKIPFSPIGDVTLTAESFAKPFGGRVGPWYGRTWPKSTTLGANGGSDYTALNRSDLNVPLRVPSNQDYTPDTDPATIAALQQNHSRYIGDQAGVRSYLTNAYESQNLFKIAQADPSGIGILNVWDITEFETVAAGYGKPGSGDILAWNTATNTSPKIRDLEIAAVAPDQFDLAYYMVEPDFYNNYMLRIDNGYGKAGLLPGKLRGDLGSRIGDNTLQSFSIKDQIILAQTPGKNITSNFQSKLSYFVNNFPLLLTSFQSLDPENQGQFFDRIGQCSAPVVDTPPGSASSTPTANPNAVPGNCAAGGRMGYSVKLVSKAFLNSSTLELGGAGVAGAILNPPSGF